MNGNRRLFTSYKVYDGGHVIFRSNLKGKVIGGCNITHDSIIITNVENVSGLAFNLISVGQLYVDDFVVSFTKLDCAINRNSKTLAKGHRRNGLYTFKLGDKSKQQICVASVVDNSTLWHRRLGHANMRESRACPKSTPSVEDDRIIEPIFQDLNGSPSLQVNVLDEGYPKSLKEAKGHPIEQVIVSSPKSVLDDKVLEDSSSDSEFDVDLYLNNEEDNVNDVVILQTPSKEVRTRIYNTGIPPYLIRGIWEVRIWDKIGNPLSPNYIGHGYSICCENTINMINLIKDLREENRDMISSINEAIKLMLAITTNMSCVVENDIGKEESKDNLKE
ncbi:retrotransposon protein [Tanacetum coccineum]